MADNKDNKRKLYEALSQDYDMGSFEQFESDIADDAKRRKLFDATSKEYDFGSYEQFSNQLGFGSAQSTGTTETTASNGAAAPAKPAQPTKVGKVAAEVVKEAEEKGVEGGISPVPSANDPIGSLGSGIGKAIATRGASLPKAVREPSVPQSKVQRKPISQQEQKKEQQRGQWDAFAQSHGMDWNAQTPMQQVKESMNSVNDKLLHERDQVIDPEHPNVSKTVGQWQDEIDVSVAKTAKDLIAGKADEGLQKALSELNTSWRKHN